MSSHDSNLPRFDATPQRHNALGGFAWKAGLLLAAAAVGESAMLVERSHQTKDPRIDDEPGETGERLIIAHFGLNTNDESNAVHFRQNFKHLGEVACIVHPKSKISLDKIMEQTVDLCANRPNAKISLYGHSWGGFANSLMISNPEFKREVGHVENVIFENSFTDPAAISNLGQALLGTSHLGPFSWAASRFISSAKAPTYQTAEMHNIARRNKTIVGSAEGFADNAICIQPVHDPYVNNVAAYSSIQALLGNQPVHHVVDKDYRPRSCHVGSTSYPNTLAHLLEGSLLLGEQANIAA